MHNVPLKIEGIERRKKSTGLLHTIAGLFLIVNASEYFKYLNYKSFVSVLPAYLIGLLSVLYGMFRKKFDPSARYNHWMRMLQILMFTVLGIFMMKATMEFRTISLFLWAVVCILLLFTERKVFHDAYLSINQNNITIPGYFSNRVIPWDAIEDVVVRQDFVTIHYPNNKFLQYEVLGSIEAGEIEKINAFCKKQLTANEATV